MRKAFRSIVLSSLASLGLFAFIGGSAHASVSAQDVDHRGLALGVLFGEPSGISGKLWLDSVHAVDFGAAYSFDDYSVLFADYLLHFPGAIGKTANGEDFTPYVGIGAALALSDGNEDVKNRYFFKRSLDKTGFGVRIPLGVEWTLRAPLGIFAEIVPGIAVAPKFSGFVEGGGGFRYYF